MTDRQTTIALSQHVETAMVSVFDEISKAIRHEARNIIDNCQHLLALLLLHKNSQIKNKANIIEELSEQLVSLSRVLDKANGISIALSSAHTEASDIDLRQMWEEVIGFVYSRLSAHGIVSEFVGPNAIVHAAHNRIAVVLVNLLLNSIDAFRVGRQKKHRYIRLRVSESSESDKVLFYYEDNAGGIDMTLLLRSEGLPQEEGLVSPNVIFDCGVTSRPDRPGLGLYLAKTLMQLSSGEIGLVKFRDGVVFELVLPAGLARSLES